MPQGKCLISHTIARIIPSPPHVRRAHRGGAVMRRTVLVSGVVSFIMAFAGTVAAQTFALPTLVEAQQAKLQAQMLSAVGASGADQVTVATRPAGDGLITVFDRNGDPALQAGAGGNPGGNVPAANISTFNVLAQPSTGQQGPIAQLGMAADNAPDANAPALTLNDRQGNARVFETVALDGTPSVELRDPNGMDRVRLSTGPGMQARVALLDNTTGASRINLNVGGPNGTNPASEGINLDDIN